MDDSVATSHGTSIHANDDSSHGFAVIDSRKLEYSNELSPQQPSDRSVVVEDTDETVAGQTILGSVDSNNGADTPPSSANEALSVAPDELTLSDLAGLTPPLADEESPTAVPSEIVTEPEIFKPADASGNMGVADEEKGLDDSNDPTKDDSSTHVSLFIPKEPTPNCPDNVHSKYSKTYRAVACFVVVAAASSLVAAHHYTVFVAPPTSVFGGDTLVPRGHVMDVANATMINNATEDVGVVSNTSATLPDEPQLDIDESPEDYSDHGDANESIAIDDSNKEKVLFIKDSVARNVEGDPTIKFDYGEGGEIDPIAYRYDEIFVKDDIEELYIKHEGELHVKGVLEMKHLGHVWLVATVLGVVVAACGLGAQQGSTLGSQQTNPKGILTCEEICWIIEHSDDFLSRKGRRSSLGAEVEHPFDVSAYHCLTKQDLQLISKHLGMDITCISSRKKAWVVSKLVRRYEAILDCLTDLEIAQILGKRVADFPRMGREKLIKLVVESGF